MSELKTVAFIREHGLVALTERFHITQRRHGEFPNLVMFKYSQIDSPMSEPVVQECRGLILDEADDWRVVSYPYRKFFNYGEGHAAPIDWTRSRVYEKLDGSLMTLYPYRGEWRVASSGTPDAGGNAYGTEFTFAELFWRTWNTLGYSLPPITDQTCFMFELMTPYNRVIVPHKIGRIVLHGARILAEPWLYQEAWPEPCAACYGWECVRSYPLTTIDECIAASAVLNPMECEGYVVRDFDFNRIKVKSPQYVALAHMKESMSPRRMLEIVRTNEGSEFLTHFPEWREAYESVRTRFDAMCDEVEEDYARLRDVADQKAFAIEATKTRWSSPLFTMRKGRCATAREFCATATMQSLERVLNLDATEKLPGLAPGGELAIS